ncbi:hypothetical protein Cni_G22465 [Canna indica]|uniref:Uncharacterized protein n=1 Tax=Canna indica TaxID=4628 RepID=A0AAQ3KRB4_9LILI|nr:hypothetical protein Cni_G22465 [Canna indica]
MLNWRKYKEASGKGKNPLVDSLLKPMRASRCLNPGVSRARPEETGSSVSSDSLTPSGSPLRHQKIVRRIDESLLPQAATHPLGDESMLPEAASIASDPSLEREALAGTAAVEHAGLPGLSGGRIKSISAVLLHSLALLPRAAQRHLRPWQLILCLGSLDHAVDFALAVDLGLRLIHVDANRVEEIADTIMALFLGLLRRTHLLSRHSSSSSAASGWLGSIQPLCRGMRRCRGLVLGIIGRSVSARCLATRSLAFKIFARCVLISEGEQVD